MWASPGLVMMERDGYFDSPLAIHKKETLEEFQGLKTSVAM